MNPGIIAALVMLVVWAVGTFAFDAPGWLHLLLTVGMFVLFWQIVARSTPTVRQTTGDADADSPSGDQAPGARKTK